MKKFIITIAVAALTLSTYAMSKAPADAKVSSTDQTCMKDAACKMDAAACKAKADAMKAVNCACPGACTCEAKTTDKACACPSAAMPKAVEEKAGCEGGVGPLMK